MFPAIKIGIFSISTYWGMLTIGALGMLTCVQKRRHLYSLSIVQCVLFTLLLTVVGVAGAKLLYVLENGTETSGVSFFGSVYLIPLLMPIVGFLLRLRGAQTLDICAPCVAIMIGCMRVGCFLTGCCGGWQMCVGKICFTWPTQAIESFGDFVILLWLLRLEDESRETGQLYPLFMVCYSVMRFFLEFLRATAKDWLGMSHGQWFSLIAIVAGLIWLTLLKRRKNAA